MQERETRSSNFPIDNLTYDVITVIHEKSKGLEAYDKYMQDSQANNQVRQIFEKIRQQDSQCIRDLLECLPQLQGAGVSSQSSGGSNY